MKEKIRDLRDILLHIAAYIFVFIISLYLPSDPDLGWHLKYGESIFIHHNFATENVFSSMMPHYYWPNGSWITDVIMYVVFSSSSFLGLSIVSAGVVTLTFFFFAKAARLSTIERNISFPIIALLLTPVNMSSFRPQQISLLFLGLLFFILSRYKRNTRILFFIPILFLFWANMHQEFFIGLAIFLLWIMTMEGHHIFSRIKDDSLNHSYLFSIFLLTVIATLINPFGFGLYAVVIAHIADPLLAKVNEYIPFAKYTTLWWRQIGVTIFLFAHILYLYKKREIGKTLFFIIVPALLLFLSFFVQRFIWPGYYLLLLLIPFSPKIPLSSKIGFHISILFLLSSFIFILFQKGSFSPFISMSWVHYCNIQKVPCSPTGAQYLENHHKRAQLYTFYDWGGWLIWNYPSIKPSIDGRMHMWKDKTGYSAAKEYDGYEKGEVDLITSPYTVFFIPNQRSPLYMQLSVLVSQQRMLVVYEDSAVLIIEKR